MPKCGLQTEVYSRVVGYHRPVKNWNKGKQAEFKHRRPYDAGAAIKRIQKASEKPKA